MCVVLSELSVKLCVKLCLNIRRFRQFLKVVGLGCEIQWKEMLASGLRDFKGFSARMRVEIEFTCFKLKTLESFRETSKKLSVCILALNYNGLCFQQGEHKNEFGLQNLAAHFLR